MATQKDLDKLRKQLSDLDAKLKSMRGNQKAPVARPPNFVDRGRDVPRTPIDMVRDPRFDSAMANQNFQNALAELRAKAAAERGTPSVDPRAPQDRFDKSKRRSGKEILLSFAGGQYGSINDEAANAIAKKYNLEIFSKPNPNRDEGPRVYGFSVKGNVDKNLSGIRNEPGIRYVSANSRAFIPERGPDPFITYEDNRMRAALNGEELPTPPVGYVEGFDRSKKKLDPIAEIGGMGGQRPSQGPQAGGGGPDFVDNRDPNKAYTMNMINYIDRATGEVTSRTKGIVPGPGSRFVRYYGPPPEGQGGSMTGFVPVPSQRPPQSEIDKKYIDDGRGGRILNPIDAAKVKSQFDQIQANIAADPNPARYFPIVKIQMPGSDALNQDLANRGMGGGIPAPIPQNPQMQTYNNLLQQGIQRSNTMNQDAASNFANMQAGAPIPQPAAPAKANPTMPIAGMGMQQPKATPVPRKFSTVNTPSARFG